MKSSRLVVHSARFRKCLTNDSGLRINKQGEYIDFFEPGFGEDKSVGVYLSSEVFLAAMFDGHGGTGCSKYWASTIALFLREYINNDTDLTSEDLRQTIVERLYQENEEWIRDNPCDTSGTTMSLLIYNRKLRQILIFTLGDTEVLMQIEGEEKHHVLSHKLGWEDQSERDRVLPFYPRITNRKKRGWIGGVSLLSVSRAFGDSDVRHFGPKVDGKEVEETRENQLISSDALVSDYILVQGQKIRWILQATDGVFDVLSYEKLRDFVNKCLLKWRDEPKEWGEESFYESIVEVEKKDGNLKVHSRKIADKALEGEIEIADGVVALALAEGSRDDISVQLLMEISCSASPDTSEIELAALTVDELEPAQVQT